MASAPTRSPVENGRALGAVHPAGDRDPAPGAFLSEDPFVVLYHELRSPLGLIATTALSAASECDEDSTTRQRLETISRVAERTLRVTETILALAREGAAGPAGELFSPAAVLGSLVDDLSAEGGREFVLAVQETARDVRLAGRPAHFEGIVQALLTNAVDHGDLDAPVRIALERSGDTLCLTIENPVAAKARHRGLGIGTYLAHRLAGELGGTLTATRVGEVFRARLAVVVAATPERSASAALTSRER